MILRKVIRLALLAFVAVSLGYYTYTLIRIPDNAIRGGGTPTIPAVAGAGADSRPVAQEDVTTSEPGRQVIAYYFHNTQRCKTCLAIEERSKSALDEAFAPAMESGALVWRAINMETPPNEHFVDDFDLVTSSLVFVEMRDGEMTHWVNAKDVWEWIHEDPETFKSHVTDMARGLLEPAP